MDTLPPRLGELRRTALEGDAPADLVDRLCQLALPLVELRPDGHNDGPVAARYGGLPSLPADVEWDGYPHFVASVDCAALPPGAPEFALPADGHLLFFANMDMPANGPQGRVVYVPAGTPTEERPSPDADFVLAPQDLHAHLSWSLPTPGDAVLARDEEQDERWEEFRDALDVGGSGRGEFNLGGHACAAFDDPCLPPYPDGGERPWRLLAQARVETRAHSPVESTLFWLIHPADLAAGRFEKATAQVELVPPM